MAKIFHEIRDPIHVFVRLTSDERRVLDSPAFQRLRHIHQLGLTYLVYPGATHRRFEHSLGVMGLAGRVFDVITSDPDMSREVLEQFGDDFRDKHKREYWRLALRMAALCHDLGHLPFSHSAERDLLPEGWNHEKLTAEIIRSDEMTEIWRQMKLQPDDIVKIALGPKEAPEDLQLTLWETILSEVITGDAFGVDRMDYLLRDSHHAGVVYGRFDHYRLIDTLRILPAAPSGKNGAQQEPALGVEHGGLHSAEALMLARYFMYSQVYFHPIRRVYDMHLRDFLKEWLPEGYFPTDVAKLLAITDNEVTAGLLEAARCPNKPGHNAASLITGHRHFKLLYQRNPEDLKINPEAGAKVFGALCEKLGGQHFRRDRYSQESGAPDFPVRMRDGTIVSSLAISETLKQLPVLATDYVFADREILGDAQKWLSSNRSQIIQPPKED